MPATPIYEQLPSGLHLVAEPWGPEQVVTVQIWVAAGSASEPPSWSGAAHLLEHMVFKGAGDRVGTQWMADVEEAGGDLNAWTSVDQTCFHITVPLAGFEGAVQCLSALALSPWLKAEDLTPERGVVLEEIRGSEDDPASVLGDRMRAALWGDHPCGRTVLGTEATVSALSSADLRSFHQAQYAPERLALVVVGPVGEERLRAAAAKVEAMAVEVDAQAVSPMPAAPQRPVRPGAILLKEGHEERVVEVIFPIPGPADPRMAALDLLTVCLGDGAAARLPLVLRDQLEVAVDTWAAFETETEGGMLAFGATPRPGRELDTIAALRKVLADMAASGPSESELSRARALVEADRLRERETVDGRAHRLGWYWHRFGDLAAEDAYMVAIARATAEDVRKVAAEWLVEDRAIIGVATGAEGLTEAQIEASWRTSPTSPKPRTVRQDSLHVLDLDGLQVTVERRPDAELLGISVIGVGGLIAESRSRSGTGAAWGRTLARGTQHVDAQLLADLVERRSGSVQAWSARNSVGVDMAWPGHRLAWALALLTDLLVAPAFAEAEVARVRDDLAIDFELGLDDPGTLAWEGCWRRLYGSHAWARPITGTAAGIRRIDGPALRRFHHKVTARGNIRIALSGPVDPDEVGALLGPLSRQLPAGGPLPLVPPSPATQSGGRFRRRVPREDAQAQVAIGWAGAGLGVGGSDEAAARVLEGVLSGCQGAGGRLFDRVREQLGLAYSVGASWVGGLGGGALFLRAAADASTARQLSAALFDEVDKLAQDGVSAEELDRVHRGLVDGAALGLQRSLSRARHLAAASAYRGDPRLWRDAIELPRTVTDGAEVQALAARLLTRETAVEVVGGPQKGSW